jgi:hypothetical protein
VTGVGLGQLNGRAGPTSQGYGGEYDPHISTVRRHDATPRAGAAPRAHREASPTRPAWQTRVSQPPERR